MGRNPNITIPRYNDIILLPPWHIVVSGFHCNLFHFKGHMSYLDTILVRHHQKQKVDFLSIIAIKWFMIKKLSGHHVRLHLGLRWTLANFGRPMSDDRLLFAALPPWLSSLLNLFVPNRTYMWYYIVLHIVKQHWSCTCTPLIYSVSLYLMCHFSK